MELEHTADGIAVTKELNGLDALTLEFVDLLVEHQIDYAVVSGYVAILFGRNRASEDIDLLIVPPAREVFQAFWKACTRRFECQNAAEASSAWDDYLTTHLALRFSYRDLIFPNIELKFARNGLDRWTLAHRLRVLLNGNPLYISPLELQIPYKLFLGSEKDIEDARFLYEIFRDHIDRPAFMRFVAELGQQQACRKWLDG